MLDVIEVVRTRRLAEGAFFCYDLDNLISSASSFVDAASVATGNRSDVVFPMFAMPNMELIRLLSEETDCGVLINSEEEALCLTRNNIGNRRHRVFSGGVVGRSAIRVLAENCATVHCASFGDLRAFIADVDISKTALGLRLDLKGDALKGFRRADLREAFSLAASRGVEVESLHSYPGTEIAHGEDLLFHVSQLLDVAREFPVSVLNFGGGFGYDYVKSRPALDVAEFFVAFRELIHARQIAGDLSTDVRFVWEPGRVIAASSGSYITRIIETRESTRGYVDVYLDGTLSHLPSPTIRGRQHNVDLVTGDHRPAEGRQSRMVRLCGATTLSTDTILPGFVRMPEPEPGDWVVVRDIGAYGRSGSHNFLSKRLPAEVGVRQGVVTLLRSEQHASAIFGESRDFVSSLE